MKVDLSKVRVGDKIWTIREDWTEVLRIEEGSTYPVVTGEDTYTFDGKTRIWEKHPSAFLECPFKDLPIEKDTLVYYRDFEYEPFKVGYYSHSKDSKHFVFDSSKKSTQTSDSHSWNIVTTENPLI